jgi:hypothetical protein
MAKLTPQKAKKYRGLAQKEFNDEAKVIRDLRADILDLIPYKDKLVSFLKKTYGEIPEEAWDDPKVREALSDELKGVMLIIGKIASTTNVLVRAQFGISAIDAAIELTGMKKNGEVERDVPRLGDEDFVIPGDMPNADDDEIEEEHDEG